MSLLVDGVNQDGEYVATVIKARGASEWEIVSAQLVLEDGTVVTLE